MRRDDDFIPGNPDDQFANVMGGLVSAQEVYDRAVAYLRRKFTDELRGCQGLYNVCVEDIRSQLLTELLSARSFIDEETTNLVLGLRGELGGIESLLADAMRSLPAEPVPGFVQALSESSEANVPGGREPEPPPGGLSNCNNPSRPPSCNSGFLQDRLRFQDGNWIFADIDIDRNSPATVLGGHQSWFWFDLQGARWRPETEVPQRWPEPRSNVLAVGVVCEDAGSPCFVSGRAFQGGLIGPLVGGQIQPPTPGLIQPPPPPPPPGITPPPPGGLPPPIDVTCPPADPCYPRPTELVAEGIYHAMPLPSHYWVAVKCLDRCSADVKCWSGDCPPPNPGGYTMYGPLSRCPNQQEIEELVRGCLGVPPPPRPVPGVVPPLGIDVPRPPGFQPPPPEPPEEEDCEVYESHPPRWDAVTPVCSDERVYFGPLYDRTMNHGDVTKAAKELRTEYPGSVLDDFMKEYV